MASDEEKIWWCLNCFLEFDLEDEEIRIIQKRSRTALISYQNRVHSLIETTFEKVKQRRALENKTLTVNPYNMDVKPRKLLNEMGETEDTNES